MSAGTWRGDRRHVSPCAVHLAFLAVFAQLFLWAEISRAEVEAPSAATVEKDAGAQIQVEARFVELSGADAGPRTTSSGQKGIDQTALDALVSGSARSVFTDAQFQPVLRALKQKKGVDLLSAPRVTTRSGRRAVIEVIREFRYANTFARSEDGEAAIPATYETRNTGVTLEVLPTLAVDGRIQLELVPQAVEFLGFVNYGGRQLARSSGKGDALAALLEPTPMEHVINQPIFATRKVTTTAVLSSGETILIGGLTSTDVSRSLFIFVTARTIAGDGRAAGSSASDLGLQSPQSTTQEVAPDLGR